MRLVVASSLCAGIFASTLFAAPQEPPVQEPIQTQSSAMIISATSDSEDGGMPMMNMRVMSSDSDGGVFFSEGGGAFTMGSPDMMGATDPFSMMSIPDIQNDIELVPDQLQQIEDIRKEFSKMMQEEMKTFRDGNFSPDKAKGMGERIKKIQEQQKQSVEKILLPHQIARLQQISLQSRMKNSGSSGMLADKKIAEELGITDEQKAKIKERAEELAKTLKEKIEALREQTREELLQELTAEQRAKLKSMLGDKFEGSTEQKIELPRRFRQRIEDKQKSESDQ
jgi:hypothetical protein